MTQRRPGTTHIHTAPIGAQTRFIGPGLAIVAGPDIEPYLVYPDGHTERIEWSDYDVLVDAPMIDGEVSTEMPRTFLTAKPGDPAKW